MLLLDEVIVKGFKFVFISIFLWECVIWCVSGSVLDKIESLMDVEGDCGMLFVDVFD